HKDYFVHCGELKMEGYKTLIEGQPVEFEESENEKGLLAKNVRKVNE
ncbi:cold shock domain-containing protein, partial [bacterium]|nr:cold shock domain-containing protein [bacterium]